MNEPSGEKLAIECAGFVLDSDPSKNTTKQIKSYLNDGLMRGRIPPKEFVDNMLNIANNNQTCGSSALQALAISLGDLRFSSMMTDGNTSEILSRGKENEFTQSVANAISPKHIEVLRKLYSQKNRPLYAEEAYFLSLASAPKSADKADMEILCKDLGGEPPGLCVSTKSGISTYYPKKILEVMITIQEVIKKRPELVDAAAMKAVNELPGKINTGSYVTRPSYDRNVDMDKLKERAEELRELL